MGGGSIATITLLRARIGGVGARLGSGTGGFFVWWGRSLAAWLPRRWRVALGLDRGRLLLWPQVDAEAGDILQLRVQDAETLRDVGRMPLLPHPPGVEVPELGQYPLAPALVDLPRWLLLPSGIGLRRRLCLPAAAADRLRDVLAFEIDRQTPFGADEVAFDARLLGRRADGRLDVELVAVPLTEMQPQRAALGALAATLAGIDMADVDGEPLDINLLPPAQRRRVADPWRRWNLALAMIALFALVMGLWQLLDNRRHAADAFEQALDARSAEANRAAAQRRLLVAMVDGQTFLDGLRSGRPTTVEVLDELSRLLPDDTYLEKVSIQDGKLLIIGLSSNASAQVRRLEESKLWDSPALTGALQPDPRSGRDRFTIIAELAVRLPDGAAEEDGHDRGP